MPDNEYWQKRAEKNLLNTEKNSEKYINELINIYDNSLTEIDNEIKKIYNKYSSIDGTLKKEEIDKLLNSKESKEYYNELLRQIRKIKDEDMRKNLIAKYNAPAFNYRISRLEALKKDIAMKIKILANKELDITKNNYINTINNSYLSSKAIISDMKMINDISFQSINKNVLNRILNTNWLGSNFSKRIWKNSDLLEKSLNDILKTGITAGLSLPKMSTKLKEAMNTSLYNATRLIRTETNYFHNEAEYQSYLDDGVTEYEYLAVLDGRTSEVCRNLNGKIFNIKEKKTGVNYPPMHPFCRSTTLPVVDSIGKTVETAKENNIQAEKRKLETSKEINAKVESSKQKENSDKIANKKINSNIIENNNIEEIILFTEDEERSILSYISSESYKINDKLRNNVELSEDDTIFIANLDSALDKCYNYNGLVVRTLVLEKSYINKYLEKNRIGKEVVYNEYLSFSNKQGYNDKANVIIYVNSLHGKNINKYNPEEGEILYKRNSKFIVENVKEKDGIYYMEWSEVNE